MKIDCSSLGRVAAVAVVSLLVHGCASPGKPIVQTVRVETLGCEQVSCDLSNDRGSWHLASTPGTVAVTSSHAPLTVVCRTSRGAQASSATPSAVGATSGAGAVVGGAVGGAAIGATMGAAALTFIPVLGAITVLSGVAAGAAAGQILEADAQAIRYPEVITLPMNCPMLGTSDLRAGAAIGLGIRGLPVAEARALGLGARSAVLVTGVTEGGAAAAAGLRSGDIVLAAASRDMRDAAEFEQQVLKLAPGTPLTLLVWRDGQLLELALTRRPVLP